MDWNRELSLSVVRIHVECVIGLLKQKYTMLQSVIPIQAMTVVQLNQP